MSKLKSIIIFLLLNFVVNAQDIKGGYINALRIAPFVNSSSITVIVYNYSICVTLLTDASQNIAHPTVTLNFGDNTMGTFSLYTSTTVNGTSIKTYTGTHTYNGSGYFTMSCVDGYRISGIKNIPNSQNEQFYTSASVSNNNLSVNVSTPSISVLPLNIGVSGNQVVYNPNCTDADNDSISYSLVNCATASNYYIPSNAIITATNGAFSFSKDSIGLYAFCIKITEWKKNSSNVYVNIGYSKIDFVIDITSTIGITEFLNKTLNASFFPNPFNNSLTIKTGTSDFKKLIITNTLGQTVYTSEFYQNDLAIDLFQLQAGTYVATLYLNDKFNFRTKLIKQ